jgi:DNA-3-methyladenine glycosylase
VARVLPRSFYDRPTLVVARELLGTVLLHRVGRSVVSGIIVETEAYIGEDDPACHASRGPTQRNAPLYGPAGHVYVYLNYGMHYLVNAVTEGEGSPAAVLIRALQPLEGVSGMRRRRARGDGLAECDLCRGPGNLTRALGISLTQNLADLAHGALVIEDRGMTIADVSRGPRVGIRVGVERPWRFWATGHPAVSGPRPRRRRTPVLR